jgi:hypothetical protein
MQNLDELIRSLAKLPPEAQKYADDLIASTTSLAWIASVGPQTAAYFSPADILLYGGQGGGGKTDLGLGLAFTAHRRSLILRRQYTDLASIIERALEINSTRAGFNGSPPPKLTTTDGRLIRFGANRMLGDEQSWQGQPFDLKVFDEACQFLEAALDGRRTAGQGAACHQPAIVGRGRFHHRHVPAVAGRDASESGQTWRVAVLRDRAGRDRTGS